MSGDPGAPVPSSVEDIAEALRSDSVLLGTMLGNGATAEVDTALHAKLDDAVVPVFVVITRTPPGYSGYGADEELTSLIHAELDEDGIYYVHTSTGGGHLAVYGDIDASVTNDDTLLSLARYDAMDQVRAAVEEVDPELDVPVVTEAGVVLDLAARATIPDDGQSVLTDAQVASYTTRPWVEIGYDIDASDHEPMSLGLGAIVGVTVAIVVGVGAFRLLRAVTTVLGRRDAARAGVRDQVDAARRTATGTVEGLERVLERPDGRGGDRRELATHCATVARDLLGSDDLLDLVGAEVLARTGARALKPGAATYRCCYVDPRHGEARHDAEIGGGLSVPVCRPCQRDLESGRALTPLRADGRPYYEGRSVWARTGYGATTEVLWADVRRERAR